MIEKVYLDSVIKRFREYKALGEKTLAQLSEAEWHWQANEASNSIALIIQHLHGNMRSRWTNFLTEDGEKPWRQRDAEFVPTALTRDDLLLHWEAGWNTVLDCLQSLTEGDLLRSITIRTQPLSVIDAINRQLAHYSYHVGQIVFLGKWLKNTEWESLSIPKGQSQQYNRQMGQQAQPEQP